MKDLRPMRNDNTFCFWLAALAVFMSFSDTQCLFLDVALLLEILKGSLFLHFMTIGANTVHSQQA